jgi:hypothetical protein
MIIDLFSRGTIADKGISKAHTVITEFNITNWVDENDAPIAFYDFFNFTETGIVTG